MKTILIFLLFELAFSYNGAGAAEYAKKWCNKYNPDYNNYKYKDAFAESVNFISQCISVGGGQDLTGCEGLDDKGMLKNASDLKQCLISKGWKISDKISPGFPIFYKRSSIGMVATQVDAKVVIFCSHAPDRCNSRNFINNMDSYSPPS